MRIDSAALPAPRLHSWAERLATEGPQAPHLALFALAFFAGAELGRVASWPPIGFSVVWPPAALYLVALLGTPRRSWARIALAAALPAHLVFYALHDRPLPLALAIFVANTVSALSGALLLGRVGEPGDLFRNARTCLRVDLAFLVANLPGTLIGTVAISLHGHSASFGRTAVVWWASGTAALFVLAPLLLMAREARSGATGRRGEAILAHALLVAIAAGVFVREPAAGDAAASPFWLLPPLLWTTVRLGRREVALGSFLVTAIAAWATVQGLGPFALAAVPAARALMLQTSMSIFAAVAVALAASVRSRDLAVAELEEALQEIRTLQGLIPICANCRKLRDDAGTWKSLEAYFAQHTDALLTHGLCPTCIGELYPEVAGERAP